MSDKDPASAIQKLLDASDVWSAGVARPPTARGRRTQQKLLQAAETIFIRDGFLESKISEICAMAGMSNGTFYTYFDSKEAIFVAVSRDVNAAMYTAAGMQAGAPADPLSRLEAATRAYVRAYSQNRGLVAIIEQVAMINPQFREMRREVRILFRKRVERGLERWSEKGYICGDLDIQATAEALTSMVSNFCYTWLVVGNEYDEDVAVRTLVRIWSKAIGLRPAYEN